YVVETRRFNSDIVRSLSKEDGGRGVALFADGLAAIGAGEPDRAGKAAASIGKEPAGDHHGEAAQPYAMGRPSAASSDAIMKKELEALIASASGDKEHALALAKEAAEAEDAMTFEYGPPAVAKPAHELFGELLLSAGRAGDAVKEFELSLAHAPERALSLLGLARAAAK